MHFQFDMSAAGPGPAASPSEASGDVSSLLGQMLEIQREQLASLRAIVQAHDGAARWRAFLERWREDFPELAGGCRQALPLLERTYGKLMAELTDQLGQNGSEALENDFALQEFLDRYGMRLSQLGTILNLVGPLAEAGSPHESS